VFDGKEKGPATHENSIEMAVYTGRLAIIAGGIGEISSMPPEVRELGDLTQAVVS
jgi:Na+/H+-translocating membrane pyrophosphatase